MLSWYHHCLFPNDIKNALLVERTRRDLSFDDYENVQRNLPEFIEYSFTRQRSPRFSWAGFVRQWHPRQDSVHVRYEDLRRDAPGELRRVVLELTGEQLSPERAASIADEFSFERQAGRRPGEESKQSFMRKGVVGDWCNHFSLEAREVFGQHAGDELILLGYETDKAWIDADTVPRDG